MDENSFNNALAAAQQLMNDDRFNAIVEAKADAVAGRKHRGRPAQQVQPQVQPQIQSRGMLNEFSDFEAQAGFGTANSRPQINAPQIQIPKSQPRQSKVPAEIQESFAKMPALSGNNGLMVPPSSYYQQPQQVITEQQYQIPQAVQAQGIDYSVIKAIVNECIKENMKAMLNESVGGSLTALKMAGGNKIQFLDSKGNMYEGVLTLKRKAQK